MSRPGKIAQLPEVLREELNRRLEQGQPGQRLLEWLNGHPNVREVLQRSFNGRPVNAPNLTAWKQSGYAEWLIRRQIMKSAPPASFSSNDFAADSLCGAMANRAAQILALRYLSALSPSASGSSCAGGISETALSELKHLHPLTQQISALRRSELKAARRKLPVPHRSINRRSIPLQIIKSTPE